MKNETFKKSWYISGSIMRWWDNEIGKIFAFHKINRLWFTHLHVFSVRGGAKVYLLNRQWIYFFLHKQIWDEL